MVTDRKEEELGMQLGYETATYGFNRQDLEAKGERDVQKEFNAGTYGHVGLAPYTFVLTWLADVKFARLAEDAAKRDAREEETLSIAKDALSIAKDANLIASGERDSASAAALAATAQASLASDANDIARSNLDVSRKNVRTAVAAAVIATIAAIAAIVAAYAAMKGIK